MKTVLIVDDEATTRKLFYTIITSLGYQAILASSAEMALSILKDNRQVATVITDFQMPGMTGLGLIEKIKENGKWKDMPILIFSAYIKISQVKGLIEAGATAFLAKPVNKKEIQEYLYRYCPNFVKES